MTPQFKNWLIASLSPDRLFNVCCLYLLDIFAYVKYTIILKYYINCLVSIIDFTGYQTAPVDDNINWRVSYTRHEIFNNYLFAYYLTQNIDYTEFSDFCTTFNLPCKPHNIIFNVKGDEHIIKVDFDDDMLKFTLNGVSIFSNKQNLTPYNIFNELCQPRTKIISS
jgi:hypothetical protein